MAPIARTLLQTRYREALTRHVLPDALKPAAAKPAARKPATLKPGTIKRTALVTLVSLSFFTGGQSLSQTATTQTATSQNAASQTAPTEVSASGESGEAGDGKEKTVNNHGDYFDANGYRSQRYRAPLPSSVPGGQVVTADQVQAFIEQHQPALIDVLSVTLRTEAIDFGISWLPESARENIPGSVWLPNVGRADLEPFMLRFFRDHLAEVSGDNKAYPVLFYCIADCWMSWNAVKRAAELGYTNLYWFPEGTDGWLAAGGEVVTAEPESIIEYIKEAATE